MVNESVHHLIPPYLETSFSAFYRKNRAALSSPLLKNFLKNDHHYDLLQMTFRHKSEHYASLVDEVFKKFYSEIRFLSYISMLCKHFVRDKVQLYQKTQYVKSLDQPIVMEEQRTYGEMLGVADRDWWNRSFLSHQIEDEELYKAFVSLPWKQQLILHLRIVEGWTNGEIASFFHVSPQAVSFKYRRSLMHLKQQLEGRDAHG